jgi:DNA-binding NarL/FixJ family response regulator
VDWPAPRLLLPWSASGSATEHHVGHILAKLSVTSRTAAVAYALTRELLS